ncbi:hypothetical protein RB597_003079 [Gaeumannomyces tritici]
MFGSSKLSPAGVLLLAAASILPVTAQAPAAPAPAAPAGDPHPFYKIGTRDQIIQSSRDLAWEVMALYPGNQTGQETGILPGPPDDGKGPYYWWQAGAMWAAMIDYWHLTGDTTYNKLVTDGILAQHGPDRDFQPPAHRASLGNDDQGFWGLAVMQAAEMRFPDSPKEGDAHWLALAQGVWVTQASKERHDELCGGGMRWQVPPTNTGYNYKNTIANGIYFNLGARLARYTGNQTYFKEAERTWDWLWAVKYIDHDTYKVFDGGHVEHNCTDINKQQFSYNAGVLVQGAAFMYNQTKAQKWKTAVEKLTEAIFRDFFEKGAAFEISCEHLDNQCTQDMVMFKGFVARWMPVVVQLVPEMRGTIMPVMRKSIEAGLRQCTGGPRGRTCGFYWSKGVFRDPNADGTTGVGEQMNVLSGVMSLLHEFPNNPVEGPVTLETGGTSRGDPNAGLRHTPTRSFKEITGGDRAGAGILTTLLIGSGLGMFGWMSYD